jgi:hypothetical protein
LAAAVGCSPWTRSLPSRSFLEARSRHIGKAELGGVGHDLVKIAENVGTSKTKRSGGVAGKLRLRDVGIGAPLRQQLAVLSALDNAAAVEDADFIGLGHRR